MIGPWLVAKAEEGIAERKSRLSHWRESIDGEMFSLCKTQVQNGASNNPMSIAPLQGEMI